MMNLDIAKTLQALMSNLIHICGQRGVSVAAVEFGDIAIEGRLFKSQLRFRAAAGYIQPFSQQSDFHTYLQQKQLKVARAFEANPHLGKFFTKMVNALTLHARMRGIRYRDLKVDKAIIDHNYVLVMHLNR